MRKLVIKVIVELVLLAIIAVFALGAYYAAFAEEDEYFILCKPGSEINVRYGPSRRGEVIGWMECGEKVTSDGRQKNGFLHVTGLRFESSEGWIYKGLLITDEPVISPGQCQVFGSGRVAARTYVDGKRRRWLTEGTEVTVYAIGEEWSYTSQGYIQTQFLTVNSKVR